MRVSCEDNLNGKPTKPGNLVYPEKSLKILPNHSFQCCPCPLAITTPCMWPPLLLVELLRFEALVSAVSVTVRMDQGEAAQRGGLDVRCWSAGFNHIVSIYLPRFCFQD